MMKILALLLIILSLNACIPYLKINNKKQFEDNLFYSNECVSSCWGGLTVGVSNSDDIEAFLNENDFDDNILSYSDDGYVILNPQNEKYSIGIVEYNELLYSMTIFINDNYLTRTTLETLINELGLPNFVFYQIIEISQIGRRYDATIQIYYPEHGFVFIFNTLPVRDNNGTLSICLSPTQSINIFYVTNVTDIEHMIQFFYYPMYPESDDDRVQNTLLQLSSWRGTGCIDVE